MWIDTEFNEYRGALISMALVAEDGGAWYGVRFCDDPGWWVREHVMPHLNREPARDADLRRELAEFLAQYDSVHIVSDWPGDIAHFCNFLEYAPGERIGPDRLTFEVRRDLPDTASTSAIPHNALEDARALARCALTPSGKIAHFDGKPMVMVGPVGNEHHTDPLYTAPQAAQAQPQEQPSKSQVKRIATQMGWTPPAGEQTQPQEPPRSAPLTDEQCDSIYERLNEYASSVDRDDFGLPLLEGDEREKVRAIIRRGHENAKENDSTGAMAAAWFATPGASKAVESVFGGRRHETEINFKYLLSDQRMRTIIRTIKVERGYRKALVDAGFAIGLSMPRPLPELTEDMLRYCMGAMGTGSPELAGRFRTFWNIMRLTFASGGEEMSLVRSGRTGWPPGLLQDDSRELSRWFASRPESRYLVDQQAKEGNS